MFHARTFKLAGGEPTLHPQLMKIIDTVRNSGICDKLAVITNGVPLHTVSEEFWKRIDNMKAE